MLELRGVSAGYGRQVVLRDVSLRVEADEVVAVLGPNGAGKTTLMKTILGLVRPISGEVRYQGKRIDGLRPDRIARRGIALVPQGRRVFSLLTVRESLLLAASGRARREVNDDLDFVMDLFPILSERSKSRGDQLSGGQQQMVALARAIMQRPSIVLLDEPSTGLSPLIVQQLPKMIEDMRARTGAAVLLVEQDAGMALSLAGRGLVIQVGQIVHAAPASELLQSSVLLESYLGHAAAG